jgi:hypothetical protein
MIIATSAHSHHSCSIEPVSKASIPKMSGLGIVPEYDSTEGSSDVLDKSSTSYRVEQQLYVDRDQLLSDTRKIRRVVHNKGYKSKADVIFYRENQ